MTPPPHDRDMADVIDLTDHTPTPGDRDLLGGKALHLAQLAAAGLPVPRAVAVPADHPEPDAAADQAHATLDAASYAVRSSSPAEDGGATSGAGRYESLLRIAPDALGRAIATVRDTDGDGPIPVIVMPFVELAAGGELDEGHDDHGDRAVAIGVADRGDGPPEGVGGDPQQALVPACPGRGAPVLGG